MQWIYKGNQIARYTDIETSQEPNGIGYIKIDDRIEGISPIGFTLDTVSAWEKYIDPHHPFKDERDKIQVFMADGSWSVVILDTFQNFTRIMEEYYNEINTKITQAQ